MLPKYVLKFRFDYKLKLYPKNMERETKNKVTYFITNAVLSIILSNLGWIIIPENKSVGIITIMIAFILLYFSFKAFQIKKNEEAISSIKEDIKVLKQNQEMNWKLLNTYMDNKLIDKINKILKK